MAVKIAMVTKSASTQGGGIFGALCPLSLHLKSGGCDPIIFAGRDSDSGRDRTAWQDLPLQFFDTKGPGSVGWMPSLVPALANARPQLMHTHGLWTCQSLSVTRAARRLGAPWVVSPHGMLDRWALQHSRWKKQVAGWLYENEHLRGASCLHALCDAEAEAIRAYGLRNPICVIPNGVDLPSDTHPNLPRWAADLPEDARVLLYLGRLHPKKGLSGLIAAWGMAGEAAQRHGWHLAIAGWDQGGHQAQLEAEVARAGLGQQVHFVGPQFGDDKTASFRRADAFVLPSLSEGLPMVVLEAWANRLPVLLTPDCHLPQGVAAGAALEMAATPAAIAAALVELFAWPTPVRQAMGDRGYDLVAEHFGWPRVAQQMQEVYRWLLGKTQRPATVISD